MMILKAKLLPNIKRPSKAKGEATTLARKAKIAFVQGAYKVDIFLRNIWADAERKAPIRMANASKKLTGEYPETKPRDWPHSWKNKDSRGSQWG